MAFGIVFAVVAAALALYFSHAPKQAAVLPAQPAAAPAIPTSGQYCYGRSQAATADAPYAVEEHVVLDFDGVKVTGSKSGTQNGPDMTNGYQGTLAGATLDREMELTYEYTVEGAHQRELEVYTMDGGNLVKNRWALVEQKINGQDILVPDYVGEPSLITYAPEACK